MNLSDKFATFATLFGILTFITGFLIGITAEDNNDKRWWRRVLMGFFVVLALFILFFTLSVVTA